MGSNNFLNYSCNPKYLAQYISENSDDFDLVWAFDEFVGIPEDFPKNIRHVQYFSKEYLYELFTSKIVIINHRMVPYLYFQKRRKQYYIQTWHSSVRLKKIEKDCENLLPKKYIKWAKKDSAKCDLIISGCDFSTEIYKNSFWYKGDILKSGTPRTAFLLKNDLNLKQKVCSYFNIDTGKKIVLYAPTFRNKDSRAVYDIDYIKLKKSLEKSFSGEWVVLLKLHPNLILPDFSLDTSNENCIDATLYGDIQELLVASDVLITDFSSCMFDYAFMRKPCILYASDYEKYIKNERELYFDIRKLPFSLATTNEELDNIIKDFDQSVYETKVDEFLNEIGSYEDADANERILEHIKSVCFK